MDMILKVEPQVLTSKAGEMSTERSQINVLMDQAKAEVNSLQSVWRSQAADEYQNRFKMVYDDIESVLTLVQNHINGLNEAAGIYTTAEQSATSTTEGLPTDGVFR